MICPVCEEGELTPYEDLETVEYLGVTGQILSQWSECDHCGSEIATAKQSRFNKETMLEFRKKVEEGHNE